MRDKKHWLNVYREHRDSAKGRGIQFLLTFEEWFAIWKASGKLGQRGIHRSGSYVMGRHGDIGPYAVDNVSIITNYENTAPGRAALVLAARRKNSEASPGQIAVRKKGQAACVKANTGAKRTVKTKKLMSIKAKARWERMTDEERSAYAEKMGQSHVGLTYTKTILPNGRSKSAEGQRKRYAKNPVSEESKARMRASRLRFIEKQKGGGT